MLTICACCCCCDCFLFVFSLIWLISFPFLLFVRCAWTKKDLQFLCRWMLFAIHFMYMIRMATTLNEIKMDFFVDKFPNDDQEHRIHTQTVIHRDQKSFKNEPAPHTHRFHTLDFISIVKNYVTEILMSLFFCSTCRSHLLDFVC